MQKIIIYILSRTGTKVFKILAIVVFVIIALLLFRSSPWADVLYYKAVDNDPDRGAATVAKDVFGDSFKSVTYLDQNWVPSDSLWFYNTPQGSNLLPYDFFMALEQKDSQELFHAPENMNGYRYLPQKKTSSNPDALPVGFVKDSYLGKNYMGFTCAACHTSQLNYQGVGIRIDGGPGAADMDTFLIDLEHALKRTQTDEAKKTRFVTAVLKARNYADKADVEKDLATYALRMQAYNFFNKSYIRVDDAGNPAKKSDFNCSKIVEKDEQTVPYGFARLDAFGRIFNRASEHVVNREALNEALTGKDMLSVDQRNTLLDSLDTVFSGEDRDQLIERLSVMLKPEQIEIVRCKIFNSPNAPVSYPFLWDTPQHDYVQWNGLGDNGGVGPLGRNTGEVIGVFGTLNWAEKPGWTISSVLGGQGFGKTHVSYQSSVDVHNLRLIESSLWSLTSPSWMDAASNSLLPPLNVDSRERGADLFNQNCAECHATIDRASSSRRVIAKMDSLDEAGTDPTMALNSVEYQGYSGILRNQYMKSPVGGILLDTRAPMAAILTNATQNVVLTPDPDKWFFTRAADWFTQLFLSIWKNEIKSSVKNGKYDPDTTASPFASIRAYKGRSLNGVWATAPYLHNGSVPTLYDLLLPPRKPGDEGPDFRPSTFYVGSREFDADKVGFKYSGYEGFLFDTSLPTNSNAGHIYGTEMTREQRLDLVEYLKSL